MMALPYIQDDEEEVSSTGSSEKTITQHDQTEDKASLIAPSVAYSTLTDVSQAQLGAGLFNAASGEADNDKDLREALEDLDEGEVHDALTPNGFMKHLLDKDGPIIAYLINGQYSTCHDDMETTVQKNLIMILQAHVLFEDCLHKEQGETARDHTKKKQRVYRVLQRAVGFPNTSRHSIIISLLRLYSNARKNEILCFAINTEEPPLPTTALNALLLMLMDRFLVFDCTSKAIRTSRDALQINERLKDRCNTVRRAIEDVKKSISDGKGTFIKSVGMDNDEDLVDQEPQSAMWTRVGAMIPSDELELSYPKPWFAEEWLSKHVPKEAWPQMVKRVMVRQNDPTDSSQQLANNKSPEANSGQAQQSQSLINTGKDAFNKRKREEGDDIESENRSKAVKAQVEKESAYYTFGDLVYRPKV